MSSIIFDAELRTDKLDAAVKQSNQTIKEWAQGVEKAGGQADAGLGKMTKSFKDAIKDQKELIKSIEKDLKNLQKAYDDATAGRGKQVAYGDLRSAKKALAEEQSHLLSLQQQQINLNNVEEGSQNRVIASLSKWVLGMVSAVAAWKAFKSIMEATERTSIAFHSAMAGAKSGLDYFMKSIASADFSNFISGMRDAIKAGSDYAKEMDRIGNLSREYKIKQADLNKTIEEQRRIFYEDDKTSIDDKIKAADNMLGAMKQKADMEVDIARKKYLAITELTGKQNKLSEDDLNYAIRNFTYVEKTGESYNKLNDLVEQYYTAQKKGLSVGGDKSKQYVSQGFGMPAQVMTADKLHEYEQAIEDLGNKAPYLGKLVKAFGDVTDSERTAIQTGIVDIKNAENQYNVESKRVYRMQQNMQDQYNKAEAEKLDLGNQIKAQEDLLNKAIESNNGDQIKAIAGRITELNKELDVREKIARQVVEQSGFEGFVPTQSSVPGSRGVSVLPQAKMTSLASGSNVWAKKTVKNIVENEKIVEESLKRELELRNKIVNAVADLVNQIGQQIGLDDKSMLLLNAGLDAFTSLAKGDIVGAAASMLSGIIAQIPSSASRFEEQIGHINQLLKEQERLIALSEERGGQAEARENILNTLDKNIAITKAEYERLQRSADRHVDLLGWRQRKADEAYKAWQDAIAAGEDETAAYDEYLTNTTASTIADSIMQGFQDGETSAVDFADKFNGFMVQAINSALADALTTDLNPWYKQLADDMESGGQLTDAEKKNLKIWYDQIIADQKARRDVAYDVAGMDPGGNMAANTGLSGIVRNMSEDTGNEMTGILRSQRDDIRQTKDYSRVGLEHLISIGKNTYNTVEELKVANETLRKAAGNLDDIAKNTKNNYSGSL